MFYFIERVLPLTFLDQDWVRLCKVLEAATGGVL